VTLFSVDTQSLSKGPQGGGRITAEILATGSSPEAGEGGRRWRILVSEESMAKQAAKVSLSLDIGKGGGAGGCDDIW
jgi:hypothetical protein